MAIAGRIEYEITVDQSGLKKGLNEAKSETNKFTSSLTKAGKMGAKALGGAIVAGATASAVAIAKMTKDAVASYADFEQLSGGIEAMFGGIEKGYEQIAKVNEFASNSWKDLTMSQNDYYQSFASTYPLMKVDIEDQNEAIQATNRLLTLNSDLANTFGYSMETASNAVNWALKGSFNYLDNLNIGIKGTQEGFLETARSVGYAVDSVKDLTSADILDILEKQAQKFGVLGKTSKEASETIQGSAKMVKASWKNLMTGIVDDGADFEKLMGDFTSSVGTFGKNILPRVKLALAGVVKIISTLAPEIIKALPDIMNELVPALIEATRALMLTLVDNLPSLMRIINDNIDVIVQGLVDIIFALIPRIPEILLLLVEAIVKSIISLFGSFGKNIGEAFVGIFNNGIKPFFEGIFSFFGDFAQGALQAFDDFGKGIRLGLQNIGNWFKDVFTNIFNFITGIFKNIGDFFAGVWNTIKTVFTNVAVAIGNAVSGAFKTVVNAVLGFVEGIVNGVVNMINVFADGINWVLGAVSGGTASIGRLSRVNFGRLATGGIVESQRGGQLILAGEAGQDEWVIPESKMASMIQQINEKGGTGSGITINIQGVFATSESEQRAVAEQIYDKLQDINKARMGAYL